MNDKNDPIGKYLGERLTRVREPDPNRREPPWRPSLPKIAAWCAALVIVAGGGYLLATRIGDAPEMKVEHARVATEERIEDGERVVGRITLVTGEVSRERGSERSQAEVGEKVRAGDVFETASGASLGIEHAGHTVVLMERARLSVRPAPVSELRVSLERGVLAARSSRHQGVLRVEGGNADVVSRGAVFTVEASGSVLEKTSVAQGEVEVLSKMDRKDVRIARSSFLDMHTWTASAGEPEKEAIEALVEHTGIELPEPAAATDAGAAAEAPPVTGGHESPSVEKKVQAALDGGDVDKAVSLIESQGKSVTSPDFLIMKGDAYRQAGKWSEASEAYLVAGETGGKKAERALIKAAGIQFRKLDDAGAAAKILDGYYEKYPQGSYLDEALYLDGAVHMKLGAYEEAKKIYERYLDLYPEGLQVVRVHLALAQILASKLSDCPGAMKHTEAIPEKSMAPAVASKVQKVQKLCGVK